MSVPRSDNDASANQDTTEGYFRLPSFRETPMLRSEPSVPMNWLKSLWQKLTTPLLVLPAHRSVPGPTVLVRPAESDPVGKFTPRAQQALGLARREANRLKHDFVATEHLLLGLLALGQGCAVSVLQRLGISLDNVRAEVEKQVGTGPPEKTTGHIPYTPRVKKVLALAAKEAKALHHTYVGTEHILLGLLAEADGVAGRVLAKLGLNLETTREYVMRELDPNYTPSSAPATPTGGGSASASNVRLPTRPAASQTGSPGPIGEPIDIDKRYDVYCAGWSQGMIVYRDVRFKGVKQLFQRSQHDQLSGFIELEHSDGQTIFVSRASIIRFCEPGATPGGEIVPR